MRKNIFDDAVKQEVLTRFDKLNASMQPLWGRMNAAEMVYHCREALTLIMRAEPINTSTSLNQYILRFLFMNIIKRFPKEAGTPKQIDIKQSNIKVNSLEEELIALNKKLHVFTMQQHIYAVHPYFGKLNRQQWGIFTWMHLDHHLRQFGV